MFRLFFFSSKVAGGIELGPTIYALKRRYLDDNGSIPHSNILLFPGHESDKVQRSTNKRSHECSFSLNCEFEKRNGGFIEKHRNVWWKNDNRMSFQVHLV